MRLANKKLFASVALLGAAEFSLKDCQQLRRPHDDLVLSSAGGSYPIRDAA